MFNLKTYVRIGLIFSWTLAQLVPLASVYGLERDLSRMLEEEAILYIGESKVFNVHTPRQVAVGNPAVADVSSVTENTIVIIPKAPGTTTFAYTDLLGEYSFRLRVLSEDLSEYMDQVNAILKELNQPQVYAKLIDTKDKILLQGEVKTQNDKEQILSALGNIKDKITDVINVKEEEATINIEAEVLEVSQGITKSLGFSMPSTVTANQATGGQYSTLKKTADAIFHVFDWPRTNTLSMTVDALVSEGKARVLSRPRLACQSGKEADLVVGGEKPIFTTQIVPFGGTSVTVEYKEYGIKLKIKPTLGDNERIKVGLNVEVSELEAAETIGPVSAPTAKAYPITKRTATTELFLDNGQTLGIGGLVKQKENITTSKVAFLGDIPVLGMLFRHRTTEIGGGPGGGGQMELVILLTPRIINSQENLAGGQKIIKARAWPDSMPSRKVDAIPRPASYADTVKELILSNFTYPNFARESGLEGTATLTLHISSSGKLLDARIKDSSGYQALDDYTLSIIKEIPSYPAFPPSINSKDLFVDIPIAYRLD